MRTETSGEAWMPVSTTRPALGMTIAILMPRSQNCAAVETREGQLGLAKDSLASEGPPPAPSVKRKPTFRYQSAPQGVIWLQLRFSVKLKESQSVLSSAS